MKPTTHKKLYDAGTAMLAGDAFVAHAEAFVREIDPDINKAHTKVAAHLGALIASATNLALAVELYLKALRMRLALPVPKSHDLWTLYVDLPQNLKISIEQLYDRNRPKNLHETAAIAVGVVVGQLPGNPQDPWPSKKPKEAPDNSIRGVLKRSNNAFQTWRYLHEGGREGELVIYEYEFRYLMLAAKSLRAHIGQLRVQAGQFTPSSS